MPVIGVWNGIACRYGLKTQHLLANTATLLRGSGSWPVAIGSPRRVPSYDGKFICAEEDADETAVLEFPWSESVSSPSPSSIKSSERYCSGNTASCARFKAYHSVPPPRGNTPSIYSDLAIPPEGAPSERPSVIVTGDVNRLLQYLHGLEGDRQRDNQGIHDHLGDLQNELPDLADYMREKEVLYLDTSVSPRLSVNSSATVRPTAPGIDCDILNRIHDVLNAVKAQADTLWDGQLLTNHLLDELRHAYDSDMSRRPPWCPARPSLSPYPPPPPPWVPSVIPGVIDHLQTDYVLMMLPMAAGRDGLPPPLIVEEDRYATVPAVLQAYPPALAIRCILSPLTLPPPPPTGYPYVVRWKI
ncbi:hypothetical protein BGW80DRAFT_1455971 [Lactifluus volemus]|nr:hypothetical protein BGW80DRAFT_1455971 [Lactifluus volemus]